MRTVASTPSARTRRRPKRSYDPEQSRRALVDAAVGLFGTKGFHEASVQEIVEAAGLTKGAFYHHFESKEDVLHVIHDNFMDAHLDRQERITTRFERAHEQLFHLVRTLVFIVADHRPEVQIFYRERRALNARRFPESYNKRQAAEQLYIDTLARGIDRGEFREGLDPQLAAFGILGMGNWTHLWYRSDGRFSAEKIALDFGVQALLGVTASPRTVRALAARALPDPDPARSQ